MDGGRKADRDTELVLLLAEVTATESVLAAGSVVPGCLDLHAHALQSTGRRSYRKGKSWLPKERQPRGQSSRVVLAESQCLGFSSLTHTEIKQRSL